MHEVDVVVDMHLVLYEFLVFANNSFSKRL